MTRSFYTPSPTHNPRRFTLPVSGEACVGPPNRQFLMGGVNLGAAITALEQSIGRPLVWATAQYLSFAQPSSVVDNPPNTRIRPLKAQRIRCVVADASEGGTGISMHPG